MLRESNQCKKCLSFFDENDSGDCMCRCGFAQSQEAYDRAVNELFNTLDKLEEHLGGSRYLCGDSLTLVDVCLFTTLIRFDLVYNGIFKCTKRKLLEYPNLHAYMRDIYQVRDNKHRISSFSVKSQFL